MTAKVRGRAVHKVVNRGTHAAVVILEPWGGEYDIGPNQALDLVVEGDLNARLEIEIEDNRLTIVSDGPDLAITRDGKPIAAR